MKKLELLNPSALIELIRDKDERELYEYIDTLHNRLLSYQLVIDNIAYNVEGHFKNVKFKRL